MKVKDIIDGIQEEEKTLIFIDGRHKGCPRSDIVAWQRGEETPYDLLEADRVSFMGDVIEIHVN